jgi:hypothetical protein
VVPGRCVVSAQDWTGIVIVGLVAVVVAAFVITDRRARRNLPRRPDRVDRLIASCRDDGQQYLAWPPGTTTPPPARPRTLVWECGCKIRPCPADEALIDVERMARTNLEDTTP